MIAKVTPYEDYTLEIELDNGHRIICDMKSRLGAVRFCVPADIDKFQSVSVKTAIR